MAASDEPPVIGLLSLSYLEVEKASFLDEYITGNSITTDSKQLCYEEAPFFRPPSDWDAVFIFHPSEHGKLSLEIKDIITAQYDILIPKIAGAYGDEALCFMVCGVNGISDETRAQEFHVLEKDQPSLLQYTSGNVIFCRTIETIHEEDSSKIRSLISNICSRKADKMNASHMSEVPFEFPESPSPPSMNRPAPNKISRPAVKKMQKQAY